MNRSTQRGVLTAALMLSTLAMPGAAHALLCDRGWLPVRTPIALPTAPDQADVGATTGPCANTGAMLDLRPTMFIRTRQFYGTLGAELVFSGSIALSDRISVLASWNVVRVGFVQNATVIVTQADIGNAALGVLGVIARSSRAQLAAYGRVLLPTETGVNHRYRTGGELGLSGLWSPVRALSLFANVSVPIIIDAAGQRATTAVTPRIAVDLAVTPTRWLELLAGIEARFGIDEAGPIEAIAPRGGLRFLFGNTMMLQLGAMYRVAGIERADLRATIAFGAQWW